ncbi:hypothetical protein CFC21_085239 [Triticum aestivum]|uniref:Bidirectional sugar transporter SWEET n=2 Tax=Triticum aestivum TaxID=4565 RepID=A0A3B6NX27_WHEAT|nr:hypothetical protein CFC21_085239 [Triticum aestivum]
MDLLRAGQVRRGPPNHHQRRRLRHRNRLHCHVPRLRPKEGQGLHGQDHPSPQHRGFGLILLLTLVAFHGERRVVSLGWICVGFSVCVFVAPLSIIGRVIKTKSVEYMPFSLSLTLTLSAVVWFLYGLLIKDKYVAMALYMFYMNATPVVSDLKEGKEGMKMPAEEHVVVINVGKIEKSSGAVVRPVTAVPAAPGQQVMALDSVRSVDVV